MPLDWVRWVVSAALFAPSAVLAASGGDHEFSVTVDGNPRRYIVHVPPTSRAAPALILNFHGGGGSPVGHQRYAQLDALADREGFLVAYPYGSGLFADRLLTWNAGSCCGRAASDAVDDVAFVRVLLDDLMRRVRYDATRVYATGLSNGAMMSYRLAAELSERIAAIAPVAGSMVLEHFAPARAVPVMHIHSVDDSRALYAGGLGPPFPLTRKRVMHFPVEAQLERWARVNGCSGGPAVQEERTWRSEEGVLHTAVRLAYTDCVAPTILWKLTGAGHVWPGGQLDFHPRLLGPGSRVIDANEEMWRFFARHHL